MNDSQYQQALLAFKQGKFKRALVFVNKIKTKTLASQKLKLQLLHKKKQFMLAALTGEEILNQSISLDERKEIAFFTGICFSQAKKPFSAIYYLEQCVEIDGSAGNAPAIYNLACLYYQEGYFKKSHGLALKLIHLTPYFVKVQILLVRIAVACGDRGSLTKYCCSLVNDHTALAPEELYELARYLIAVNDETSIVKIISYFEEHSPQVAISLSAELLAHQKQYSQLNTLLSDEILTRYHHVDLLYFKAQALDKLKIYSDAYTVNNQAAELRSKIWSKEAVIENVSKWHKWLDKCKNDNEIILQKINNLSNNQNNVELDVVFIFSFPRSGTTLLDNILDTQSDITVLSEVGIVPRLIAKAGQYINKFPDDILMLKTEEIKELKAYYIELASELGNNLSESKLIVDKGPHHTEVLPFLKIVFPTAKFITAIRHPMDVCLSCFQQNFEFNSPNSYLTTFDRIVNRYIKIFDLLERYQNELGIDSYFVKYEDIVNDFEASLIDLFKFLEFTPDNSYLNFHQHAAQKFVSSASRGQTEQPLYKTSVIKWKNYQEQLLTYKEKLSYFIEKYGYQDK